MWGTDKLTPVRMAHGLTPVSRAITPSLWSIRCSKEHCYRLSHLGHCCCLNSSPLGHRWPMVRYSNIIWLWDDRDPYGQPQLCSAGSCCPEGVDWPDCPSMQSYWNTTDGPSWSTGLNQFHCLSRLTDLCLLWGMDVGGVQKLGEKGLGDWRKVSFCDSQLIKKILADDSYSQ